jgi:hypothetical protein
VSFGTCSSAEHAYASLALDGVVLWLTDPSVYGNIRNACIHIYQIYLGAVYHLLTDCADAGGERLTLDVQAKLRQLSMEMEDRAMMWWFFVRRLWPN